MALFNLLRKIFSSKNKNSSDFDREIDLVYLWVNGADPVWMARKNAFTGTESPESETNCKGRHADNAELKYSLRSVEKHLPWIRNIFIVTDDQTPDWLDTSHPKIRMISHRDILPPDARPCYNSVVIEYFLYRIPGLSEYFLYGNDDMFFNAELSPRFFFAADGLPYVRLRRKLFGQWRYRWKEWRKQELSIYRTTILNTARLVQRRFGVFYSGVPHHNVDAYRKTDYEAVVTSVFKSEIDACLPHRLRSADDLQRSVFLYYALVIGRGHLKYVRRKESFVINVNRPNYEKRLQRYHPQLFCLNDNESATEADRERIPRFLEKFFPAKSVFEK
jgi:hypothetical protein